MNKSPFHDEISLAEEAEKLGKQALRMGLIPGLTVHIFPDSWQFYVLGDKEAELLTPEEAYLRFKKLTKSADT